MRTPQGTDRGLRNAAGCLFAALVAGSLSSCAALLSQGAAVRPVQTTDGLEAALEKVEAINIGESRLLYLYERGLVLHHYGDYARSNEALEEAHALFEDLYTRSLTREAAALVTGDYLLKYRGERFEAALVHYYAVMNYLELGRPQDAAIECRRLNHELQRFHDEPGSFYTDDPFLQYITGLVYELAGERVDADVSLRAALDSYRGLGPEYGVEVPSCLLCDLAENASALGRPAEAERYRHEGGCAPRASKSGPKGTLKLFLECGQLPYKAENTLEVPIFKQEISENLDQERFARELARRRYEPVAPDRNLDYVLKIAMPALVASPSPVEYARIRSVARGDSTLAETGTTLAANLGNLSIMSFEERKDEILVRAAARSLAKYLAQREAKRRGGRASGLLTNLLGVLTESADTRCWSGLPDRILMAHMELPPGSYRIEVELFGSSRERVGSVTLPDVEIRGGRSTVLSRRVD